MRDIRLNQLRERVEPRAGGDRGRQLERQLRIHHREARQHQRAPQADLDLVLGGSQHGVARNFRPGAGRRGDGDEGDGRMTERLALANHLQVIAQLAAVGQKRRNGFSCVDGAPSAESNHQVALFPAGKFHTLANRGQRRVLPWTAKLSAADSLHFQCLDQQGGTFRRATRDQERSPAHLFCGRSNFAHHAGSEQDARGGGKFESASPPHQPSSAGKILEYLTLVRGSAIMGATLSRQVA